MENFKRLAILFIIFGFISLGWITTVKVSQIVNFKAEVEAIATDIVADTSALNLKNSGLWSHSA